MIPAPATAARWSAVEGVSTQLGEGLHWDAVRGCLWMVDIHGRRLLRALDTAGSAPAAWPLAERLGWVIPCADDDALMLGLQSGFARLALPLPPPGTPLEPQLLQAPFGARRELRLNDAKADASGAIWAGSLNNDDESRPDGALWRLSPAGELRQVEAGYCVSNGPALSADGRRMLHTDSVRRTVWAFDLDAATGTLSNKRVWRRFDGDEGHPDGMCFDAEGAVWIAQWGAGCIGRYDAAGRLLRRVALPAPHVTNVCFGGDRLQRLFVSSARTAADATVPLAGALFEVHDPGTAGLPGGRYRRHA